jgi:hypothetical protein
MFISHEHPFELNNHYSTPFGLLKPQFTLFIHGILKTEIMVVFELMKERLAICILRVEKVPFTTNL